MATANRMAFYFVIQRMKIKLEKSFNREKKGENHTHCKWMQNVSAI